MDKLYQYIMSKHISILFIFCLLLSACSRQPIERPETPHPSEWRLLDYEKMKANQLALRPRYTVTEFMNRWNAIQEEQSLELPLIKSNTSTNLQADHHVFNIKNQPIQLLVTTGDESNDIKHFEMIGRATQPKQMFLMVNSWAILLALTHPDAHMQPRFDEANRLIHELRIKPNANLDELKHRGAQGIRLYLNQAELFAFYSEQSYHLRLTFDSNPLQSLPNINEDFSQIDNVEPTAFMASSNKTTLRENLTYLYFGNPALYVSRVDQTNNTITAIAPNYFDILSGGQLDVTWKLDTIFIAEMKRRGIRVVPFLSNHWNRQKGIDALSNAEGLSTSIATAIEKYQLDGVNVDIEGVGSTYRDSFTQFVRLLREKIPAHKEVSVAVAANPNSWNTGWHGFYDYRALADLANYLMIMSYDESWEGSEAGPVSSISFFERSIQYALKLGIDQQKIVMGIPFYGRLWQMDGEQTSSIKGIGVSNSQVASLISQYGAQLAYDDEKQSAYLRFNIPVGAGKYIAGKWCDSGQYMLWYENETSIKQKLRMIARYGVRGAGSWSLYQEADGTWEYFAKWLNGNVFRDVPLGHWAETAIMNMNELGWLVGVREQQFEPNQSLTRAQAAVILARALQLSPTNGASQSFSDVSREHWAYEAIESTLNAGMMMGLAITNLGERTFAPDGVLTREQLSVILARALAIMPTETTHSNPNPFVDLQAQRWSYGAIMALYQRELITGIEPTMFGLRLPSTRAQMAMLMNRIAPLIRVNTE